MDNTNKSSVKDDAIGLIKMVLLAGLFFVIGQAASGQFTPPPPVIPKVELTTDAFTTNDRMVLYSIQNKVRAIHAKLFPLEEERRLLDLH